MARRTTKPVTLSSGPWKGTRTTEDPGDDPPFLLLDATNLYIPDPTGASGAYQRPGLSLRNNGSPVVTPGTDFRGQGVFHHVSLANVITNFIVVDGTLLRADATLETYTDVTPVGITIDDAIMTRVYGTNFADYLIITDGVNPPWLASDLTASPVTGQYIDFDGLGRPWASFGPATIYGGSDFFPLASVDGVGARTDIAWCFPGLPAVGYQQPKYDFRWTLMQTAADPLYALAGTDTQLYYFRRSSIGSLSGDPGPSLAGSKTNDAISRNVGTLSPQCVIQFGNIIYFVDAQGRPYRLAQGASEPEAIWYQMRGIVDDAPTAFSNINATTACAGFEPGTNTIIFAPWTASTSQQAPATEGYMFDAASGVYFSRFVIGQGCQMDAMGILIDASGRQVLTILGSAEPPSTSGLADSGYVWTVNALAGEGDVLATMDSDVLVTMGGDVLVTMGSTVSFLDDGEVPQVSATTGRMGYDLDTVLSVDRAQGLVGSSSPVTVSAQSAAVAETVEAVPTPSASQDGVNKFVACFDAVQGRGISVTVSPTETDEQFILQKISVVAVSTPAMADDL